MADMTELERKANQYITQQVASGVRREDVLADWIRSENPELQKYAKGLLVQDLNPAQAAQEAKGNEQPQGSPYLQMAKDMAPYVIPPAAAAAGAYYLGKKKAVEPPALSDFEAKKQQLELERMQLQNDVERARLTQMATKGQSLDTQAKFSQPTPIEVAAGTTSVKNPSPATQTNLTPEDLQAKLASLQQTPPATPVNAAPSGPNVPPQFAPGPVSPAGNIPPAPVPSYTPNSPITTKVSDTINDLMDKADAPKTTSSGPTVQSFARDANGNVMWPEKMSPAGREGAEAFMKQYPNHAAELAKEGRFGILGAGSGDNNLFNAYGADLRKTLLAELNNGQFVGEYENYKNKIAPSIRALPPETGLGKELADMRINDPKSANRGGLGVSGAVMPDKMVLGTTASKALKTGGKAFLGLAIADAANAATKGNTAPAKEVGFDLASGALLAKILGGPASIASALGLGSAGLNQGEEQDLAYRRKVGAGRGIAPPSAYMR